LYKEKLEIEINTLEKERKRIAADLHDELGPLLSSVRLQIACLETQDKEDLEILEASRKHIDTVLVRLREIANDLMPTVLLRKGLQEALREFINSINAGSVALKIDYEVDMPDLNDLAREIHIFRILQEIIHNAIKHSKAGKLRIRIEKKEGQLLINVQDNGQGFDADKMLASGTGHGLSNIYSRIDVLKGYIHIKSKKEKGTEISMEIPFN
jgi:signal transduction histidine kinase